MKLNIKLRESLKQEAMAAVIPLAPELQHFFYTVKMPNLGVEGSLKLGERELQ